jgi:MFS family permease
MIAATFAFIDRQILSLVAQPVQTSFALSDAQVGLLQGTGVALFAGVAAIPLGWLADRMDRRILLALAVLIWSASTASCGFATGYSHLFASTIGIGIGEAGLVPIVYGLIPELFPPDKRVFANAVFAMASLIGGGLGIGLGGAMIQALEVLRPQRPMALAAWASWRLAFIAVAMPAPLVALAILTIRTRFAHTHPASADPADANVSLVAYAREHRAALVGFFGAIGLVNLALLGVMTWVPVIAIRLYGATAADAGKGLGMAFVAGSLAGFTLCTVLARRVTPRWGAATPLRLCELGLGTSALLSLGMLAAQCGTHLYLLVGCQLACVTVGVLLFPTLIQGISPPALRSRVTALGTVITIVVQALSPLLVGLLSDQLSAGKGGLLSAVVTVSSIGYVLSALLMRISETHVVATIKRFWK